MNVFLSQNGQQYGPYTVDQIKELYSQGKISLNDSLCHDEQNWISVQESEWLTGSIHETQSASGITPSRQAHPKNKRLRSNRHKQAISTIQKKATSPGRLILLTIFLILIIGGPAIYRKYAEVQRKERARIQEEQSNEKVARSFAEYMSSGNTPLSNPISLPPITPNPHQPSAVNIPELVEEKVFEYEPIGLSLKIPRGWSEEKEFWENTSLDTEFWKYVLCIKIDKGNLMSITFNIDKSFKKDEVLALASVMRDELLSVKIQGKQMWHAKLNVSDSDLDLPDGMGTKIIGDHLFWFYDLETKFLDLLPGAKNLNSRIYFGMVDSTIYRIELIYADIAAKNELLKMLEESTVSNKINSISN